MYEEKKKGNKLLTVRIIKTARFSEEKKIYIYWLSKEKYMKAVPTKTTTGTVKCKNQRKKDRLQYNTEQMIKFL